MYASLDWVLENPLNALWLLLFTRHPCFAKWPSVVLSYCKLRWGATPYRKTTRLVSTLPSVRAYAPPCTPKAPCAVVQQQGRHARALGEMAPGRAILGYYARSQVPASLVADYLEAVVARRLVGCVSRLLIIDLCAGHQSARMGMDAYRRRDAWRSHRDAGCEIAYVSVDRSADCAPLLCVDLLSVCMDDLLERAFAAAGWAGCDPATVAVFAWFSPPCETYSTLALGTLATAYWGGPQRQGKEAAYAPVGGKRGAKARAADRLVCRVLSWLHSHATG